MYRPTIRMDDVFRDWMEEVKTSTGLDFNQIVRLALFIAPYSDLFKKQIKKDVTLPSPPWDIATDRGLWRSSRWNKNKREVDVIGNYQSRKGLQRKIHQPKIFTKTERTSSGGIRIITSNLRSR